MVWKNLLLMSRINLLFRMQFYFAPSPTFPWISMKNIVIEDLGTNSQYSPSDVGKKLYLAWKMRINISIWVRSTGLHLFCIWWLHYSMLWTLFLIWKWMLLLWEGATLHGVEIISLQTVFYLGKWLVSKVLLVSRYMCRVELAL